MKSEFLYNSTTILKSTTPPYLKLRMGQVQFFGKAGICWHGLMIIRKATAAELEDACGVGGKLRVAYFDAMTVSYLVVRHLVSILINSVQNDKKECSFSTLSLMEACSAIRERHDVAVELESCSTSQNSCVAAFSCTVDWQSYAVG